VSCYSKTDRVGRDGFLRLVFERRRGQTVLAERRYSLPLQALEPSRLPDGSLYMMMLNPTGGIFGGDQLRTEIVLGAGTHVVLTTPSASKIHRALGRPATSRTEISIGEDATVEYLPDHLIPHPGAALRQDLGITMAPGSSAIVYDAMVAGRIGREERWSFREVTSEISIDFGDRAGYLSRSSLVPALKPLIVPRLLDGFDYFGSIVALRNGASPKMDFNVVDAAIAGIPGVWAGASALATEGVVGKFLANSAAVLTRAMFAGWSAMRKQLIGLCGFDLRKL
jgi:urease accessory protein